MITFNISGIDAVRERLESIDMNNLCLNVASTLKAEIRHRVHVEGKASDGSQIGTYSKGYLILRSGAYPNASVKTKGKNKGQRKDAGYYTKGAEQGSHRKKYNRGVDPKVILSLTRQMENDMNATEPIPITDGYGIGYSNDFNYHKAIWNEKRYGKPIWSLTKEEENLAEKIVSRYVDQINR